MAYPAVHWLRDVVFPIGNFSVFVGVLFYFLREPSKRMFHSRSKGLNKVIADATAAFDQAKQNLETAKKKLNEVEKEKESLIKNAKEEIETLKNKSREELNKLIETMRSENEHKIKEETIKAQRRLKWVIAKKIILAAQTRLKTELKEKDFQYLDGEYLKMPLHLIQPSKGKPHEGEKRGTIRQST